MQMKVLILSVLASSAPCLGPQGNFANKPAGAGKTRILIGWLIDPVVGLELEAFCNKRQHAFYIGRIVYAGCTYIVSHNSLLP